MDGVYEIMLGGRPVGQAAVFRRGLYLYFDCRCRLSGETVCRLRMKCGETETDLGIPVPEGGWFVLRTRVSARQLGRGKLDFVLVPKHAPVGENFVPLSPATPFAYLHRLEQAFLTRQNGVVGISFREPF